MSDPQKIAVIGAGLMGHGIAYLLARAGHSVSVFDTSEEARASLGERISDIAQLLGDDKKLLDRVQVVDDLAIAVAGAAFVIEAATENVPLKQKIFADLETLVGPDCILASNTSSIPLRDIGQNMTDTKRLVGAHFWNPPHLVPLVEVSQLAEENLAAVEKVIALLAGAGRHPVHVKRDIPGFIGNRLQHAIKREAIALVASGICDAETIDDVVKFGFGKRMAVLGPMEQSDLVGLDLTRAIHEVLLDDLDTAQGPHPFLIHLIEAGKTGMDAGEGFRKWTPDEAAEVRARLRNFLAAEAKSN
ncbi:MAG: NAD(P)-binding domain-containing protein [Rhodospirillales bacterium]|nr:NAD(P)-binding domain-containing protein [Rhodospirillales bacterium]